MPISYRVSMDAGASALYSLCHLHTYQLVACTPLQHPPSLSISPCVVGQLSISMGERVDEVLVT